MTLYTHPQHSKLFIYKRAFFSYIIEVENLVCVIYDTFTGKDSFGMFEAILTNLSRAIFNFKYQFFFV